MQRKELTGKPALMRELNIGLIKAALEKHQKATRVELSAMTGISQPTVNMLIGQLLEAGVVVSAGVAESTGGRKAEMYTMNQKRSGIVSVVVGEEGFSCVITDLELKEETRGRVMWESQISRLEQLCLVLRELLRKNDAIQVITVGVPGAVSREGAVFSIPQLAEWEQLNLKQILEETFSLPVIVVNDINAIVIGYAHCMEFKAKNLVYVNVGTGIGAGILIEGKLYPGCKSFAGEVGHMRVGADKKAEEQLWVYEEPAKKMQLLANVITNIICVLNPEMIVMGGEDISEAMFKDICSRCADDLPKEILPEFAMIEDGEKYYFYGLGQMGKEVLDRNIRLV